jgi:hypothetical protein
MKILWCLHVAKPSRQISHVKMYMYPLGTKLILMHLIARSLHCVHINRVHGYRSIYSYMNFILPLSVYAHTVYIRIYRRLVADFPPRRSGFEPRSDHAVFVVDKLALGRFYPITLVSPTSSHCNDCSTLVFYRPRLVQQAI